MTDKTLGAYKRTTPDPDETTGEALARLQAEMTRLLDEADAELRDEAEGGVAAALIEKDAEKPTAADFATAEFARHAESGGVGMRKDAGDPNTWCVAYENPGWRVGIRSDIEMARDGWAPVRECPDPEQHDDARDDLLRLGRLVREAQQDRAGSVQIGGVKIAPCDTFGRTNAENAVRTRAEKAQQERDHWEREADNANKDLAHLRAAGPRPLTPDAITDAAMRRAVQAWEETGELRPAIFAALTTPARPEGAEEIEFLIADRLGGDVPGDVIRVLADEIAERAGATRLYPKDGAA
ncbi:hypothetical protein DEU31_3031 [Brachybacterium sp. AG952]|uniref:hypothetical protein n=1 Tax=Brachybacterium sp. AG952 TaxID=2183989 RepID=UPI001061156B|nr:hypothetical protein [Brachybacterium sp. AG952]TDP76324.1 hypothetical protein DEU31_3031 [Brachybacterium sp. AG952]